FVLVLFGLAVPEQAVIIPRYQLFAALDLHNTYVGLMLPGMSGPFGVFLMTQYFKAIPKEIDEAAELDGASRFRTFWRVLLPMTLPAQATLGIYTFLHAWNDYWWPLISGTNLEMYTITVGIAASQINFAESEGLGFLMAQALFAALPILVVYLFFQRHIVRAVSGAAECACAPLSCRPRCSCRSGAAARRRRPTRSSCNASSGRATRSTAGRPTSPPPPASAASSRRCSTASPRRTRISA